MAAFDDMEAARLRAVVGRIIPSDDAPGALDLGSDRFVRAHCAAFPADAALIAAGLATLGADFVDLPPDQQDDALIRIETAPWFARLVTLVCEGFYADPDNGGNDDARSWEMIGYRHGLPEGSSGPPAGKSPA